VQILDIHFRDFASPPNMDLLSSAIISQFILLPSGGLEYRSRRMKFRSRFADDVIEETIRWPSSADQRPPRGGKQRGEESRRDLERRTIE
jgi:hypothetical protein